MRRVERRRARPRASRSRRWRELQTQWGGFSLILNRPPTLWFSEAELINRLFTGIVSAQGESSFVIKADIQTSNLSPHSFSPTVGS